MVGLNYEWRGKEIDSVKIEHSFVGTWMLLFSLSDLLYVKLFLSTTNKFKVSRCSGSSLDQVSIIKIIQLLYFQYEYKISYCRWSNN